MSRFDRAVGLARSLAIYHAMPWRQRRLRRMYRQFVRPGDLVFDVGAHVGNHVRCCAALGCRVIALEPQPDFARLLQSLFGRSKQIVVLAAAVGEAHGLATLSISERTPTVTSLATAWRDERAHEPGFESVRWNRRVEVEVTTLDALIARFGLPAFVKIDVEGSEPAVLAGLTCAVASLSFEYLPGALSQVEACLTRLASLGHYEFNWSVGESYELADASWSSGDVLLARLGQPEAQRRSGDVYARLVIIDARR